MYTTFVLSLLAELVLIIRPPQAKVAKSIFAGFSSIFIGFSASSLLVTRPSIATLLCSVVGFARLINPLRIAEARMHPNELKRRTLRTFIALAPVSTALYLYTIFLDKNVGDFQPHLFLISG